jgi:hypothetical protein
LAGHRVAGGLVKHHERVVRITQVRVHHPARCGCRRRCIRRRRHGWIQCRSRAWRGCRRWSRRWRWGIGRTLRPVLRETISLLVHRVSGGACGCPRRFGGNRCHQHYPGQDARSERPNAEDREIHLRPTLLECPFDASPVHNPFKIASPSVKDLDMRGPVPGS